MKKKWRAEALARRNAIPSEKRAEKSTAIVGQLLQSEDYRRAACIFSYVSIGSEVETRELLAYALRDGKAVAVPKTGKNRKMEFLQIFSLEDLQEGRFGVMEPVSGMVRIPQGEDLFLVPLVSFDGKKNRLGYGGGYYDTYFAEHTGYRRIGLAFSEQKEQDLPTEEWDIPLDAIVTENEWEV